MLQNPTANTPTTDEEITRRGALKNTPHGHRSSPPLTATAHHHRSRGSSPRHTPASHTRTFFPTKYPPLPSELCNGHEYQNCVSIKICAVASRARLPQEYRLATAGVSRGYRRSIARLPQEYPAATAGVSRGYRRSIARPLMRVGRCGRRRCHRDGNATSSSTSGRTTSGPS